ncbi:MAG TPA: PIG-L deacetylase family protein [Chloroflexia bacterium]|nr:PIG-L deacetylase family protein [Chloroflexia bacterium]
MRGIEAFEGVERAIVVCAHADDMETMMGATAGLLADRGVELFELICTRGDLGSHDLGLSRDSLAALRLEEARRGAEMLGFSEVAVLEHHDGELEAGLALRSQVAMYYRLWQPDVLFTFDPDWPGQIHPDHRAAGRAAIDALIPSRMPFYHPEQLQMAGVGKVSRAYLFSPASPSVAIDVTDVYDRKVAASLAHASQFPKGDDALDWMRTLDTQAAEQAGASGRLYERFAEVRLW